MPIWVVFVIDNDPDAKDDVQPPRGCGGKSLIQQATCRATLPNLLLLLEAASVTEAADRGFDFGEVKKRWCCIIN